MRLKLRLSIVLAVVGGLLLPALVGSLLTLNYQERALASRLVADHARITEILALGIEEPLWNVSPDVARPLFDSVLGDERVVSALVRDAKFGVFLSRGSFGLRMKSSDFSSLKPAAWTSFFTYSSSMRWSVSTSEAPVPALALESTIA